MIGQFISPPLCAKSPSTVFSESNDASKDHRLENGPITLFSKFDYECIFANPTFRWIMQMSMHLIKLKWNRIIPQHLGLE